MKDRQSTLTPKPPKIRGQQFKRRDLMFYPSAAKNFNDIMSELEEIHHRTAYYALTSGGKDSISVVDRLANMGKLKSAVYIQTGVGLQITIDHLHDYCQEMGWPLRIIEPNPKYSYANFVLQCGFPGPAVHKEIMARLKFHTMNDFAMSVDRKNHVLISGVRKFESHRRMGNYPYPVQSHGQLWFACPAFYETDKDVYRYVMANGLKLSPAYARGFGVSGDCLCGTYATRDSKRLIMEVDQKLADYIKWLEEGVQKFGTPAAKRYPHWGDGPTVVDLKHQKALDDFFVKSGARETAGAAEAIICGVECGPGTMRGTEDY